MKHQSYSPSRRNFLQSSLTLAGGLSVLPADANHKLAIIPKIQKGQWYQKPLRILQTVLRESDAGKYDARSVVNYMQKAHCNVLVVNAGGIVDFFQNPLPASNINPFMGSRDILKEITDLCKTAGIRVIARVDFRGVEEHVYNKYLNWFSYNSDGSPMQLNYTRPQLYASCYTGYYRNEHAIDFLKYLLTHYAIDGIWHNSIGVGGICHCDDCKASWHRFSGREMPTQDSSSELQDAYMQWKSKVADEHMETMKKTVKSFGDDKVYTAEIFSMFETGQRIHSGIDLYNARDHFDFMVSVAFLTENSDRIHYEDLSYAGTIIRFLKSIAPQKEAIILYGGNGTAHRYVMDPSEDLKVWLWQALAAGGRFWNCNFTGMHPDATHDRRNAFNNIPAYRFVKENQAYLENQNPWAQIGIYYSKSTRLFYRSLPEEGDTFEGSVKGIISVVNENHIPFDFLADDDLDIEKLTKYKLIILSNVRCMSERECEVIEAFVRNGGTLLATYASSLYTENGSMRDDFALAKLFGCSFSGEKWNTRKDHYQHIVDTVHPMVSEFSDQTELLINAGYSLLTEIHPASKMICSLVPVVHNQPPEKAWSEGWSTRFPSIVENTYGKGKVLYFSNQPDQVTFEIGHPDMRDLLANAIRYLAPKAIPWKTNIPESVHIGLTESSIEPGAFIISVINTSSAPARPLRNILPVYDLRIEVELAGKLSGYSVLYKNESVKVKKLRNGFAIRIRRLDDYNAVFFKLT